MDRTRMDRGYFYVLIKVFLRAADTSIRGQEKKIGKERAKERKRSFQRLEELEAAGEPAIHRLARIAKMNNLEKEHYHGYQ